MNILYTKLGFPFLSVVTFSLSFGTIGCGSRGSESSDDTANSALTSDDWRHVVLASTDDTHISIDFQNRYEPDSSGCKPAGDLAKPLWVNMTGTGFNGFEPVIATFTRYCKRLGSSEVWSDCGKDELRLSWSAAEQKFTGQLPDGLVTLSTGSEQQCLAYEVSFFIGTHGGYQLIDPTRGTPNFVLSLASDAVEARCAS